ncbi:MAG: 2Fe-2S iron-sulfur cluster-binding protein [Acidimicrobiia bacterium]
MATVAIHLLPDDVVLQGRPGEPILDTLRRSGYSHRFGCRRGGCGVCRIDLVEGTTHDNAVVADTVLTPADRAAGVRLSCRAVPDGDVTLRVREDDRLHCVSPILARYVARRSLT